MASRAKAQFWAFMCVFLVLSGAARPEEVAKSAVDLKPIGKFLDVSGAVTLEHATSVVVQANLPSGPIQQAKINDLVYQGDLVRTGPDSAASIAFVDGTSFKISANARMELDEFVYDPKGSSNSTLINLTAGNFTFLAGMVAKTGNMKVETPVATLGIRGTAPRVEILDNGAVKFSTLIEEHKSARERSPVRPPSGSGTRRAQVQPTRTGPSTLDLPPITDDKLNLTICRRC